MKYPLFYIIFVLLLCACTNSEKKKEAQLYREVMGIKEAID